MGGLHQKNQQLEIELDARPTIVGTKSVESYLCQTIGLIVQRPTSYVSAPDLF